MMNELYTQEDVKNLSARIWKCAAICIGVIVIALGVGITTCFFVTDENAKLLQTINIVLSSLCACVALYFLLNEIMPKRAKKAYVEKMLNSTAKMVRGRVADVGKKVTVVKYVSTYEVRLLDEEGKDWILYLDAEKQTKDLKGHIVEFKVVNNKIVGYGDAQ